MRNLLLYLCVPLAAGGTPLLASAEDLASLGPVYEIREKHGTEMIIGKLREMERRGELAKWEAESKTRLVDVLTNPKPIAGLGPTRTGRTFYYDPTYTVPSNIVDAKGNVLFPAGYRKNPLEVFSLSQHLLFFDGRDAKQVKLARRLIDHYDGRVMPILVAGSFMNLMRDWKQHVYFDQFGFLVNKLGIGQVPALVSQEGLQLRIDEVKVTP